MKKLISVFCVGALLAGCGGEQGGSKTQASHDDERKTAVPVNEQERVSAESSGKFGLDTQAGDANGTEQNTAHEVAQVADDQEKSPHAVIFVEQTPAGPRFFCGGEEIALNDISSYVSKSREQKVLLRADPFVQHALLLEVIREIAEGGRGDFLFALSQSLNSPKQPGAGVAIELPGPTHPVSTSNLPPMPRFKVRFMEGGEIALNGTLIEDGSDAELKALVATLKREQEFREQLIASEARIREEAELVVEIEIDPSANQQLLVNFYKACAAAGVKRVTFRSQPPEPKGPRQKVKLQQRQKNPRPTIPKSPQ